MGIRSQKEGSFEAGGYGLDQEQDEQIQTSWRSGVCGPDYQESKWKDSKESVS